MIYLIIGNIVAFFLAAFLYYKYSQLQIKAAKEAKSLGEKYQAQIGELRSSSDKLNSESKNNLTKIESLLSEINELRKEKENEAKLRLNAEKQVELALQQNEEFEKRMDDWHELQEAAMQDSLNAMLKVGNDLFRKMGETYKNENEITKNFISKIAKTLSDLIEKSFKESAQKQAEIAQAQAKIQAVKEQQPQQIQIPTPTSNAAKQVKEASSLNSVIVKDAVSSVVETAKDFGLLINKDYFLPQNFAADLIKLVLCDLIILREKTLYFIDFKAVRYFEEFKNLSKKDKNFATENLKQRLDKYFTYLANIKYQQSILKALSSSNVRYEKISVAFFVGSSKEEAVMQEIAYDKKAINLKLKIFNDSSINDIIL